ncbi:hypothetical protein ACFPK9_09870 [Rubritalea spongiae]|uniref:BAG domain-containing protein n=1 Tax=Rubritalea spongiae TaxID=430797 RepID=A0ABW5DZ24_9BACT
MKDIKSMEDLHGEDRELYHADRIQRARCSVKRLSEALLEIENDEELEERAQRRLAGIARRRVTRVIEDMDAIE